MSEISVSVLVVGAAGGALAREAARRRREAEQRRRHEEYLARQAERERRHQEYLQRQAERERRYQEYLQRQAQRQAREQAYLDRVQETTSSFYHRYVNALEELEREGLAEYVQQEFERLQQRVEQLADMLESDPIVARDLSFELGREIGRLPHLAREAKRRVEQRRKEMEAETRRIQAEQRSQLGRLLQTLLGEIRDPIEYDFALDDLRQLRQEIAQWPQASASLAEFEQRLRARMDAIRTQAARKAEEWKQAASRQAEQQAADYVRQVVADEIGAQAANQASDVTRLRELVDQRDRTEADESVRRYAVAAIMDSLQRSGFLVEEPMLVPQNDQEVVLIQARKPAGQQAAFQVQLDGHLTYKFDQYEGMACKEDIEKVQQMLEEIYGVKLSDVRVLWQNPDRISRTAKPLAPGDTRHGHA